MLHIQSDFKISYIHEMVKHVQRNKQKSRSNIQLQFTYLIKNTG